jgi:hypothetical protein
LKSRGARSFLAAALSVLIVGSSLTPWGSPFSSEPGLAAPLEASSEPQHTDHQDRPIFHRTKRQPRFAPAASQPQLTYHGGPVQHDGTTAYAIYWQPTGSYMSPTYRTLIERYFQDVGNTPFLNVITQYPDNVGNIPNSTIYGGAWTDTTPYPSNPVFDSDLRDSVRRALTANPTWQTGLTTEFFVFTAKDKNSCDGSDCSFTEFCAYHWFFTMNGQTVLYANQPYTGTSLSGCGVPESPNNDIDADSTINVVSHEHKETMSDPILNAWFDINGAEGSDKCAWTFGDLLSSNSKANVMLNGNPYMLQQEWSNVHKGCVITWDGTLPSATSTPAPTPSPTPKPVKRKLKVSRSGSGTVTFSPTGQCGSSCFFQGTQVTLTASGVKGFFGWSGACTGTDPCVLTMDSDKSVKAYFNPPKIKNQNPGATWDD